MHAVIYTSAFFLSQDKQLIMIKVAVLTSVMINDDADEQQKLSQP